jgi:hypothetical protein
MSDIVWIRPGRCESSACPEVAFVNGRVMLRSSLHPHNIAILDDSEWAALRGPSRRASSPGGDTVTFCCSSRSPAPSTSPVPHSAGGAAPRSASGLADWMLQAARAVRDQADEICSTPVA